MKKILAAVLAIALIATLSLSAVITASATDDPTIVVSSVTAKPGETVSITINLVNNPGLASMKLKAAYDSDLTLNAPVDYTITQTGGGQATQPQKNKDTGLFNNPVALNWVSPFDNVNGDHTFATLSFTIDSNATEGDKVIKITYDQKDVYNLDEDDVVFATVAGKVTVVSCFHENTTKVAAVASTCKTAGHGAYTKCLECGAVIEGSDDALALDPANHEGGTQLRDAKAATCTELGYTGDIYCLGCETVITKGKDIEKLAHTPGSWKSDAEAHWKECTVCNTVIGESVAHDFEQVVIQEATLEAEGSKGEVCKVCGYVDEQSVQVIPKLVSYDVEQTEGKTEEETAVYDATDAKEVGFTAKFAANKLKAVKINGVVVDEANYDVVEDGEDVKVVLKEEYLKTLGNGNYTITVVADDGIAQSAFTVKNVATADDTDEKSSKTGDMDIALLVFALVAMMGASVFAGVAYRKKVSDK